MRMYEVWYRSGNLEIHHATCKIGFFTGIFWSGDGIPSFSRRGSKVVVCRKCGSAAKLGHVTCAHCEARALLQNDRES